MKKIVSFALFIFILIVATLTYATDVPNNGYVFNLSYQGEIKKSEIKKSEIEITISKKYISIFLSKHGERIFLKKL